MATHDALVEVADDDYLQDGYFNDVYKRIKKFSFSDATEEGTTSGTYVTLKTGTLTPDDTTDNILVYLHAVFDIKVSVGNTGGARVQIVGDETFNGNEATTTSTIDDNKDYTELITLSAASSYTVNLQVRQTGDPGNTTTYVNDVTLDIYVVQGPMASASPSFS